MKCISCGTEMEEDYTVKLNDTLLQYCVIKKGYEKLRLKACVCPDCGRVSLYTDDIATVKEK